MTPLGSVALSADPEGALEQLADGVAARLISTGGRTTWVSVALLNGQRAFAREVPLIEVPGYLNELGAQAVAVGLVDVQFWLQRRTSKASAGLVETHGVVIDVDQRTADVLGEVERVGLPMPNFHFESLNGYKLGFVFDGAVEPVVAREVAVRATLALEGADPRSWEPSQAQRLPTCLKSTGDGTVVPVNFVAHLSSATLFPADPTVVPFPHRVLRALGSTSASPDDRQRIRVYLESLGMEVPLPGEKTLQATCPISAQHDSKCCYVNVRADGEIWIHCLGGHGPRTWLERELAHLARSADDAPSAPRSTEPFDPLHDLPVTYASIAFVEQQLASWSAPERSAAIELWQRQVARIEAPEGVDVDSMLRVYRMRLRGDGRGPAIYPYFDVLTGGVRITDRDGRVYDAATSRLNATTNAHELRSTAGFTVVVKTTKQGVSIGPDWAFEHESLFHKMSIGHRDMLARLGVPAVSAHEYPLAFLDTELRISPRTKNLTQSRCAVTLPEEELSPVDFFMAAFHQRRLPLATPNDVLLFIALLASPLLREIGVGQLGIYWVIGPSGVGKEFLVALVTAVWRALNPAGPLVSFDVLAAGDLELKRSLEGCYGALFARVKEAGKREARVIDELIRMSGTDTLSARGVGKQERILQNVFTFIAESAEDVPLRREISRRTLVIHASPADDSLAKNELLTEAREAAPRLISWLRRRIEERGKLFFLNQHDTGSRPLMPVGLTRMLGAQIPTVEAEDLGELFEAMREFTMSDDGIREGLHQLGNALRRAKNESVYATALPSYRFTAFAGYMRSTPTNREVLARFGDGSLANRIQRETDYHVVTNRHRSYLPLEVCGDRYALRLEGPDKRRFIFCLEAQFLAEVAKAQQQRDVAKTERRAAPVVSLQDARRLVAPTTDLTAGDGPSAAGFVDGSGTEEG